MLITALMPLLERYALGFDLIAGTDGSVTLTIIPRKAEGSAHSPETAEIRPISITASAVEIDAELGRGMEGALGQLITARKALGDQIAEQKQAAEEARTAAALAAKAKSAAVTKSAAPAEPAKTPASSAPPAAAKADEPASLW
ncbi:MAG: PRTRC system protein E [Novosphingobium sp.]|jgi:PRTRC genetic system protein E|nr:PRTRC system protein E [Novosphingobium sp.]